MTVIDEVSERLSSRRERFSEARERWEQRSHPSGERRGPLTRTLGWFSIGLGAAEMAMPGTMSKLIGVRDDHRALVRSMGMREIAAGVGILAQRKPAGWIWARVAGDAVDLSLLGAALSARRTHKKRAAIATAAVAGVTALDIVCGARLAKGGIRRVRESIAINKSPEECYQFWHDFENMPRIMTHVESVRTIGENRLRWRIKAPAGVPIEWDAEIVEDRTNQRISWQSAEDARMRAAGTIRFEGGPGGRGTILHISLSYVPPGGALGALIAKRFGVDPEQRMYNTLHNFKKLIETGEIISNEGPSGRDIEPEERR